MVGWEDLDQYRSYIACGIVDLRIFIIPHRVVRIILNNLPRIRPCAKAICSRSTHGIVGRHEWILDTLLLLHGEVRQALVFCKLSLEVRICAREK